MEVMSFANLVSDRSEKIDHHPKIIIDYDTIVFELTQGFLVSKINQNFKIGNKKFFLKKSERILVEISNKFTIQSFTKLASNTGWPPERV